MQIGEMFSYAQILSSLISDHLTSTTCFIFETGVFCNLKTKFEHPPFSEMITKRQKGKGIEAPKKSLKLHLKSQKMCLHFFFQHVNYNILFTRSYN